MARVCGTGLNPTYRDGILGVAGAAGGGGCQRARSPSDEMDALGNVRCSTGPAANKTEFPGAERGCGKSLPAAGDGEVQAVLTDPTRAVTSRYVRTSSRRVAPLKLKPGEISAISQ